MNESQKRAERRLWAAQNPEKVYEANRRYRLTHKTKTNEQAKERMRRYRERKKAASQ